MFMKEYLILYSATFFWSFACVPDRLLGHVVQMLALELNI